ncbi:MAG: thioredoxin-disulfide reductase [Acidimicrobiales bacterium]|nr:thioredoxin-disulfide reductase [Acidimicrobiales bacterium]|tara:strand:+ start:7208 stop:8173 length:966 start_codon:yes stop_codon:yes gene_type:complete
MSDSHQTIVIIGSGPAGLTAAIYTARAELNPLVIEGEPSSTGDQPGGQLMLTTEVENFPGFPDGILGPQLMADMKAQAERFGATFLTRKVTKVDLTKKPFEIWIDNPDKDLPTHTADALIISTGAQSVMLEVEGEKRLLGHGLSTCATCDGFFFKDKKIAVVGGGDSAIEEATFLTKFASEVTVIHRRDELRASKIMQKRAHENPKINFLWDSEVTEILGSSSVEGVKIRNTKTLEETKLDLEGIFIAIGHTPNTSLFIDKLSIDDLGYINTEPQNTKTNVEGVFACGDVQDHKYRQAVTAAGSGCMAAIDAEHWLENQKN